ncbi:MAG: LCP family protein [Peptostreptococcaceae bacterium]
MKKIISAIIICSLIFINIFSFKSSYGLDDFDEECFKGEDMVDNILLIGRDGIDEKLPARSDTMIILTIDKLNESLKLTSLARDTLVEIPNKGYEKLNHAYAYGEEELLVQTINKNFDLNIKDYAVVNFKSFIDIIDILGGVDVKVSENEIEHLNQIIEACYGINNEKNIEYIKSAGNQNLNGYQALAYARIRKIDTIYKRDERQRIILANMAQKLSTTTISNYPQIVKSVLRYVKVNISFNKVMKLALMSHELGSYEIRQLEFPIEEYRQEGRFGENGTYVIKWDKEKNVKELHKFIYGNQ